MTTKTTNDARVAGPKVQCCATIWGPRVNSWPCHNSATVERDGKPYCKIHDPVKRRAKAEIRDKVYQEKSAAWAKRWRLESAAPELLSALQDLLEASKYLSGKGAFEHEGSLSESKTAPT